MKKIITFILAVFVLATLSIPAFAADAVRDPQQSIDNAFTADSIKDAAVTASEAKGDTIQKSDVKAFKGKLIGLYTQLNKLREECRDLWTQIKTSNEAIKKAWSDLKASLKGKDKEEIKKILTEKRTVIEPLRAKVKAIHTDILSLREQKKAQWADLRAAIRDKDEGKATEALKNIIDLKSQIIEKQKELLPLKQQILDTLK